MNKLMMLFLIGILMQALTLTATHVNDGVVICNNAITNNSVTLEMTTTTSLTGLEMLSDQPLRFTDTEGNTVVVNGTVTEASVGATTTVTLSTNENLTGWTIVGTQEFGFVKVTNSATVVVNYIVTDVIVH